MKTFPTMPGVIHVCEHPRGHELLAKRHNPRRTSVSVRPLADQNNKMATPRITTLDRQLYAWLVESDERRFTLAFNVYFSVAFPAVVRFLARISRWDSAHLEELAQDALLRFFDRVGRDRREASVTVAAALQLISPLDKMGSFHARQVNCWTEEVSAFRTAAMSFTLPQIDQAVAAEAEWKSQIRSLADKNLVIQRQGWNLLDSTLRALGWSGTDSDQALGEMAAKTARAAVAEEHYPGASLFVKHTLDVVSMIPRLRVPTNAYLFDIATTVYLDECKKRGRLKRGGSGDRRLDHRMPEGDDHRVPQHPIELATFDSMVAFDGEECCDEAFPTIMNDSAAVSDPTLQYEDAEYFAKFYEYLHKPLSDAARAYENAPDIRRAEIERQKLKSLAAKFARITTVLSMLGAGNTQEQTAEHLGISRNQVKYIVEVVQEAYEQFAAVSAPLRTPKRKYTDVQ